MRLAGIVAGIVITLIGLLWVSQGAGLMPGSAMTGQSFWLVIGLVLVVVGSAIAVLSWRQQ